MSAQALNGNSYSGYVGSSTVGGIPTRDASDITRQKREQLIYNQYAGISNITPGGANLITSRPIVNPGGINHVPGNSEWSWLPYGNQFRLSYLFGKMNASCNVCSGNAFDDNGPINPLPFINVTFTDSPSLGCGMFQLNISTDVPSGYSYTILSDASNIDSGTGTGTVGLMTKTFTASDNSKHTYTVTITGIDGRVLVGIVEGAVATTECP